MKRVEFSNKYLLVVRSTDFFVFKLPQQQQQQQQPRANCLTLRELGLSNKHLMPVADSYSNFRFIQDDTFVMYNLSNTFLGVYRIRGENFLCLN